MIKYSKGRTLALTLDNLENNPFVTGARLSGTASTSIGSETSLASYALAEDTYSAWIASGGTVALQVDLDSAGPVTMAGVFPGDNVGGMVMYIEYSSDGITWADCGLDRLRLLRLRPSRGDLKPLRRRTGDCGSRVRIMAFLFLCYGWAGR